MKFKDNKNMAFTLAEVLITLGIIGIVAAMTIPSLITEHREKETIVKLKKFYSTIQQAQLMAINHDGSTTDWEMSNSSTTSKNSEIYYDKLKKYLNIAKDCGIAADCLPSKLIYSYRNGANSGDFGTTSNFAKAVINDGSLFWIDIFSGECSNNDGTLSNICGHIMYDINGYKKPNKMGDDLFYFVVFKDKIVPTGMSDYKPEALDSFENGCYKSGGRCSAWVIYNENMDYKHCTDLNWKNKTKC